MKMPSLCVRLAPFRNGLEQCLARSVNRYCEEQIVERGLPSTGSADATVDMILTLLREAISISTEKGVRLRGSVLTVEPEVEQSPHHRLT
jgi:hypothetical protein